MVFPVRHVTQWSNGRNGFGGGPLKPREGSVPSETNVVEEGRNNQSGGAVRAALMSP